MRGRNIVSCRVDWPVSSADQDFIALIVAVFLSEQLKVVWLKFGVLDFRRKRLTLWKFVAENHTENVTALKIHTEK